LDIDVAARNDSLEDLTFTFQWSAYVRAIATVVVDGNTPPLSADAFAYTVFDATDDLGAIEASYYVEADGLLGPTSVQEDGGHGTVAFTLAPGGENLISVSSLDSYGYAEYRPAQVPIPGTVVLLGIELLGLMSLQGRLSSRLSVPAHRL
jgi:hypothetical protein